MQPPCIGHIYFPSWKKLFSQLGGFIFPTEKPFFGNSRMNIQYKHTFYFCVRSLTRAESYKQAEAKSAHLFVSP